MTAQAQPSPAQAPALVVFGCDQACKPHASSFTEGEVALAEKAAKLMGLSVLPVRSEAERALAARVPKGRVFGSGKAFVPFIKAALLTELQAASLKGGVNALKLVAGAMSNPGPAAPSTPKPVTPLPATPLARAKPRETASQRMRQPSGWADIQAGAIVLAAAPPLYMDWFECVVIGAEGTDSYTLRYSEWPNEPPFTRRRVEVALLHPAYEPLPPHEPEPPPRKAA